LYSLRLNASSPTQNASLHEEASNCWSSLVKYCLTSFDWNRYSTISCKPENHLHLEWGDPNTERCISLRSSQCHISIFW
jgi:hypothetical protein